MPAVLRRLGVVSLLLVSALVAGLLPAFASHEPPGGFDGDPRQAERIGVGASRFDVAVDISRHRFADGAAEHAVIVTPVEFADALTAGSLLREGPMLFSAWNLEHNTEQELRRVLPKGKTVYIVGGEAAVSPEVEQRLRSLGYATRRLAGQSRVETAIVVADEVVRRNPSGRRSLLARAYGTESDPTSAWADSITVGGYAARHELPLLISTRDTLHPAVAAWLERNPRATTLLGGEAALSAAVERAIPRSRRVGGKNRAGTAALIATELWGTATSGPRRLVVHNGYAKDIGQQTYDYLWGLPAAGFVSDFASPMVIVHTEGVPEESRALLSSTTCEIELRVLGMEHFVPDELIAEIDALDRGCDRWTPPPASEDTDSDSDEGDENGPPSDGPSSDEEDAEADAR